MSGLARDLTALLDSGKVLTDPEDCHAYACDAVYYFARRAPEAVVLPETPQEISGILRYASDQKIPVTPRGAGTGLSAGCTPVQGGIVLDMKRMNRVLEINRGNMTARVESGAVLGPFQQQVEAMGLFYPPDPQSQEVSTIGGNVSTRAGGPRGVKYGTTAHYVLGLEVVLPDGEMIRTGGTCVKQSVGYDLTHLMTGAEGTLGVITKVNLRLLPLPPAHRTAVIVCETLDQAAMLVSEIIAEGTIPARLEYVTSGAVQLMNATLTPPLSTDGEAYLFTELDGSPAQVEEDTQRLRSVCDRLEAMELRIIGDEREAETYWRARRNLAPTLLRLFKKMIVEDVTVPRDRIPDFVRALQSISASLGLIIGIGGHAGDGNIHPSIMFPEINDDLEAKAKEAVRRIVRTGLEMGGTISGEHGIGLHKAEFLVWELGEAQIALLKRIKKAFDPRGIMNPGKIWQEGGEA
ncbi:MAG: FAD-binding protein [Deltaproteobacteria bacterium]|nr:FAD-binding protein [Deltaproteobacteria bacterium]MBW1925235.1 FAD-binding protein [Deltaproteobacteria bacterium]MBW1950442.1 FAD-binding protein [Deltaproteobacteria bacterium]MBW2008145.1 FAD-binding protein [Deltaproteobacteria bacterium]MBW2103001.1 FAD-binding protein [Deltaproteobacteria bacterium]